MGGFFFANFERHLSTVRVSKRATIILRRSPRKSSLSERTGIVPPLRANFSYGQKMLGLATNKRSHGRYQARTRIYTVTHVHLCEYTHTYTHTFTWIPTDLDLSANVAYACKGF